MVDDTELMFPITTRDVQKVLARVCDYLGYEGISMHSFRKTDNSLCCGYNLNFPDVIAVRNELLPAGERETNHACDLNDHAWMDAIDASNGAVFFAAGVFYYLRTEDVKALFAAMVERFSGAARHSARISLPKSGSFFPRAKNHSSLSSSSRLFISFSLF